MLQFNVGSPKVGQDQKSASPKKNALEKLPSEELLSPWESSLELMGSQVPPASFFSEDVFESTGKKSRQETDAERQATDTLIAERNKYQRILDVMPDALYGIRSAIDHRYESLRHIDLDAYDARYRSQDMPTNFFHKSHERLLKKADQDQVKRILYPPSRDWMHSAPSIVLDGQYQADQDQVVSMNVSPDADLIKKLDALVAKYPEAILEYKFASNLDSWAKRVDPVTLYVNGEKFHQNNAKEALKELAAEHVRELSAETRKAVQNGDQPVPALVGEALGENIALADFPTPEKLDALESRVAELGQRHPQLENEMSRYLNQFRQKSFSIPPGKKGPMVLSVGRFHAIQQALSDFEKAAKTLPD